MSGHTTEEKLKKYFERFHTQVFDKGHMLMYPGDALTRVFFLHEGSVRQYKITKQGTELVVNTYEAPSHFPLLYIADGAKSSYFYDAFSTVKVSSTTVVDFLGFVKSDTEVAHGLLEHAGLTIDELQGRAAYLMSSNARGILLFELVSSCKSVGVKQSDGSYILQMHELELANRSGLSRETISRHIHKLDYGKLIEVSHEHITVKDLAALESLLKDSVF